MPPAHCSVRASPYPMPLEARNSTAGGKNGGSAELPLFTADQPRCNVASWPTGSSSSRRDRRMDEEQASLLSHTLREVLAGPPGNVDELLRELGWDEVVAADPATATRLLFTEQGRALARTNLLDRIVLDALANDLGEPA